MPIVFLPVPSTFSRLWCPQDHRLLVWIRRWITSTFATSAGGTSVRVPLSRSTCAPTRATSPSSAMCARRLSPPRGISRYSQEFPPVPPAFYSIEFLLVPFFWVSIFSRSIWVLTCGRIRLRGGVVECPWSYPCDLVQTPAKVILDPVQSRSSCRDDQSSFFPTCRPSLTDCHQRWLLDGLFFCYIC